MATITEVKMTPYKHPQLDMHLGEAHLNKQLLPFILTPIGQLDLAGAGDILTMAMVGATLIMDGVILIMVGATQVMDGDIQVMAVAIQAMAMQLLMPITIAEEAPLMVVATAAILSTITILETVPTLEIVLTPETLLPVETIRIPETIAL